MYSFRSRYLRSAALALCLLGLLNGVSPAATIFLDGSGVNSTANLNDGASIDGTPQIPQSSYAQEFAISTNPQDGPQSGTIQFSLIPVVDLGLAGLFFEFVYDAQETGGAPSISIDDIVLSVGNTIYWDYDQATLGNIVLNGETDAEKTYTPLGNGSDLRLLVPVALFAGAQGSDILTFSWTQSSADNGADEWVTVGSGYFPPDTVIDNVAVVPEPTTLVSCAGVGLCFALGAWRKRRQSKAA